MQCKSEGCVNPKPKCGFYCGPCRNLRQRYNLDVPKRIKLLESQGGRCKVCKREITFNGTAGQYAACIDHNHETGVVRGVLCGVCNSWIGYIENEKIAIETIADYLK